MKQRIFPIVAIFVIILSAFGAINLATRPEPTAQEIMAQNPRYTFMIQCGYRGHANPISILVGAFQDV